MAFVSAYKSDTGQIAQHNEDYIWVDETAGIFIIADGMGGNEAGEVASELAANTVGETIRAAIPLDVPSTSAMLFTMANAIERANRVVWQASEKAAQVRRMGATIVVAVLNSPAVYLAHAGDARIYVASETSFTRLTEDDSWVAQLMASGIISTEEAKNNRLSHIVTKVVGQNSPVEANVANITVKTGDWLLMCSDGLWNMLSDEQIFQKLQKNQDNPQKLVDELVKDANEAGGRDNISVIAVKII